LPPTAPNASIPPTFDLSPTYVAALDTEFTRVYDEYTRRVSLVQTMGEEIIKLWAELGIPQAQTDANIVKHYRGSPEQLGLREDDMARLKSRRDKLVDEKRGRERKLAELKSTVEDLWERLGVEEPDKKAFLMGNRGCGMRQINEFEDELSRLNELKRQNMHLFVEDARCRLQELWDGLYFSEEEMLDFTPAFSDVYSDALLSAHEAEISRLQVLMEERAPTLDMIENHRTLVKDRNDLAAASQDATRLIHKKGEKRDPTRLLREEKMRKRIAKELPKVEVQLRKILEKWEDEYGRPFLVHGERYLDELEASAAQRNVPARSKTPTSSLPPQRVPTKTGPPTTNKPVKTITGSAPRPGAKTPTSAGGTLRRNPMTSSVSTAGHKTPSKLPTPGRRPLAATGNNSPERNDRPKSRVGGGDTMRGKMGPPAKAPPPKMRDLFVPPQQNTPYAASNQRSVSTTSSGGSVRHVTPEDVYDDRYQNSAMVRSLQGGHPFEQNGRQRSDTPQEYPSAPHNPYERDFAPYKETRYFGKDSHSRPQSVMNASRQISATSNTTANTGSENWESYTDGSEVDERDASEAYYEKMRTIRGNQGKRFIPEGGYAAPHGGSGKKMKDAYGHGVERQYIEQDGQMVPVDSASDAGWTTEDAF
jgi:Ase1/PRC1/MAP65 family protein